MATMIYVNLPVKDLDASKKFFTDIGYTINQQFTDETASCVVFSDTICAMLITEKKFQEFAVKPAADTSQVTEALIALGVESRDKVDEICDKALASGGSAAKEPMDEGFMYARSFFDPDGHHWEILWMDPAVLEPQG